MMDVDALRGFLARILGWAPEHATAIENAVRAIHLSMTYRAALVLLGDVDLVPIARAIHLRTVGPERPFVVCDPRRPVGRRSVRSPSSRPSGVAAFEAARGGTLCMRVRRRPQDFADAVALARDPTADVQVIVCAEAHHADHPFLILPPPICIPSLKERAAELPRIVDEYAHDAIRELGAEEWCFIDEDRRWVLNYASESLSAIETATARLVALAAKGTSDAAGKTLGMTGLALRQWRRMRRVRRVRRGGSGVRNGGHTMRLKVAP
jgi:hypothetical protein